MAIRKQ